MIKVAVIPDVIIAASDLFRRRDFDPRRKRPASSGGQFAGQFASLGHLNAQLQKRRTRAPRR